MTDETDLALSRLTILLGQMTPYNTSHGAVAYDTPQWMERVGCESLTSRDSNPNSDSSYLGDTGQDI